MNKLLIISGPTASGKTDLAIRLAKKYNGEIISADSRQAYREMSIGTGKDICGFEFRISNFEFNNHKLIYYEKDEVKLWGYDVVYPNEEWSPAHFARIANVWIKDILKRNKLPIVVGGDGFYLKTLINPPQTLYIKPDRELRKEIGIESVKQLRQRLRKTDPRRFNRMNWSDQNNPRRLVRAIEVASSPQYYANQSRGLRPRVMASQVRGSGVPAIFSDEKIGSVRKNNILQIGLIVPISLIDQKIELRVQARLKAGVEKEARNLVGKYGWNRTLLSTIAYKEWKDYFEGKETRKEAIKNWMIHEKQYARKQMTWFKKQLNIKWFDISEKDWKRKIFEFCTLSFRTCLPASGGIRNL